MAFWRTIAALVAGAAVLAATGCNPPPTVRYQNAPNAADPEVKILALAPGAGFNAVSPDETDINATFYAASGTELMIFGNGKHPAGVASMTMKLFHDGSLKNIATLTQTAAIGAQVQNPVAIYASDGLGNAAGTYPFSFKLTDDKYSVELTARDAAGHQRTITGKFGIRYPNTGCGSTGTIGTGTSGGGSTPPAPTCTCPNPANPLCGSVYGQTCSTSAECVPGMLCLLDPAQNRKYCQKQNLDCPAATCWKPSDLGYDRTRCFKPAP